MDNQLIGRVAEQKILQETITSNKAELIAIIDRRRVGKIY